jgi:CubicO group peptidase (beta-lactamase class C family)
MSLLVSLVICGLTGAKPLATSVDQSAVAPGADATGLAEVQATGLAGANATGDANRLAVVKPAEVGMDPERLSRIQPIVQEAIDKKQIPGAVVLVVRRGKICFREAIGFRSLEPTSTPMTVDTVFDLASLTKPIATASALMILVEQGKLRLNDRVAEHLPEFGQNGKEKITVEQLLLHTSGLIGDNPEGDYRDGPKKALEHIYQLSLQSEPSSKFRYSDVGYIVLGQLVEKLSGETLDSFTCRHILEPLAMRDTAFKPTSRLAERAAPTEQRDGRWIRGEVHDPRAYLLGGVAGHAGLFSTADDLAIYTQMLLNQGEFGGKRILSPATVRLMIAPRAVSDGWRTLGWDVQTSFSSNRGDLFRFGSFGHTGFTGTSIWIDPSSETAVIFLSNRVHPQAKGNINRLRGQVATVVAASIVAPPFPKPPGETSAPSRPEKNLRKGTIK